MNQYGATGLQLDGHSRGSLTIGNAMEAQSGQPNSQGSLSQTNINFSGPAYNAQDAANLLQDLSGNPNSTLRLQNHVNDPIGRILGGNPGTGGTTPEGSSAVGQAIRAVTLQPNTVHNCYGSGAGDCSPLWNGGRSELVPVIPQRRP